MKLARMYSYQAEIPILLSRSITKDWCKLKEERLGVYVVFLGGESGVVFFVCFSVIFFFKNLLAQGSY